MSVCRIVSEIFSV